MKKPIIQKTTNNEKDFEYNVYAPEIYFKYKKALFTGTVIEEDEKSYTEYTEGNEDGRSVEYYDNGQIESDSLMSKGRYVSGKEWYYNGQLKSDDKHLYNEDGKLIRIDNSWLYPNGFKKNDKSDLGYNIYSSKGNLAITTITKMTSNHKNTNIYYDNILLESYEEILINLYPELDTLFYNTEYYIWGWVIKKYSIDKESGLSILNSLDKHRNNKTQNTARTLIETIKSNTFNSEEYLNNLAYHTVLK